MTASVVADPGLEHDPGAPDGHREISPSAWSRAYGPPQVAGVLSSVAFSPSGKVLAVGASGGLKSGSQAKGMTYLLNAISGTADPGQIEPGRRGRGVQPRRRDAGHGGRSAQQRHVPVESLGSSADKIATLNDHDGSSVESVSFSPNGKMLATNDRNGVVYLWRLPRGPQTTSVSSPGSVSPPGGPNLDAVAFSPRGTTLAMGGSDGQAYLFNTATDSSSRTLGTPDSSGVTSVAFSHNGALLAASEMDGVTYVWNLDTAAASPWTIRTARSSKAWRSARTASGWPPVTPTATPTCGTWPRKRTRTSRPGPWPTRKRSCGSTHPGRPGDAVIFLAGALTLADRTASMLAGI